MEGARAAATEAGAAPDWCMMAKRSRLDPGQASFANMGPPRTPRLFSVEDFPYQLPDEVAYNEKRKREGLHRITAAEEAALRANQAGANSSTEEQ